MNFKRRREAYKENIEWLDSIQKQLQKLCLIEMMVVDMTKTFWKVLEE
jgi:hypothetical protein